MIDSYRPEGAPRIARDSRLDDLSLPLIPRYSVFEIECSSRDFGGLFGKAKREESETHEERKRPWLGDPLSASQPASLEKA